MAITASEARRRLFALVGQVNDDQEAVEIVSTKGTAFLVSAEEYISLVETAYLTRSPANARALLASIAQLDAGEGFEADLLDPDDPDFLAAVAAEARTLTPGPAPEKTAKKAPARTATPQPHPTKAAVRVAPAQAARRISNPASAAEHRP